MATPLFKAQTHAIASTNKKQEIISFISDSVPRRAKQKVQVVRTSFDTPGMCRTARPVAYYFLGFIRGSLCVPVPLFMG